jgi:FkbM family methyltransferase
MSKFNFWKEKGFCPNIIYDIGANIGDWTREMQSVFSTSTYYLFEGCSDNNIYHNSNYHNVLLGKDEKEVDFYCVKPDRGFFNTGNSIYLELTDVFKGDNFYTIKQNTHKLDTYISEHNIPYPDFIKIDVQGAELDILEGGLNCLKNAKMVLLEVSIHRYNAGAPLFSDVIKYMDVHDFETIDIIDTHIINGYTAQLDILFAKKGSGYRIETFKK